jgi:hypothetical protein
VWQLNYYFSFYRQLQSSLADLCEAARRAPNSAEVRRLYNRVQRNINATDENVVGGVIKQRFNSLTSLSSDLSDVSLQPDVVTSANDVYCGQRRRSDITVMSASLMAESSATSLPTSNQLPRSLTSDMLHRHQKCTSISESLSQIPTLWSSVSPERCTTFGEETTV